ncbi:MAG: DUF6452 family protein [Muribaculum sp.]|nr:DUF6452 family protein [Muribaculum sp.]
MGKVLGILLSVGMAVVAVSCNTTGCVDNKSSIPLAGFYSYETLGSISLSNISVGGIGAPNDSLLLDHASASTVYLPFRSLYEETAFFIRYEDTGESDEPDTNEPEDEDPGDASESVAETVSRAVPAIADTLRFKYERIPYFASEDCGAMYRYRVIEFSATHYMIDSIALVDSLMTNVDRQTIQIYFRTQTSDDVDSES